MADQQKNLMPIDYTHREFSSIREDLMRIAERFYPDTFQDFSEASFGSMMLDSVAYVADQLSFYLDYNVNEAFLDTSFQFDNVVRHGRILGYKFGGRPSTYGTAAFYILVPSSPSGLGPDTDYIPVLKRGTTLGSQTGNSFVLTENINFADPKNITVAARVDPDTGTPTYYAIKAYGNVVSGRFGQETITIGAYTSFLNVTLNAENVSEVISVFDAEGNEYFEVEYLAQDMIYKEITNPNFKDDNVPSIMKPFLVSRKFTVETGPTTTSLQFGSGKEGLSNVVAQPQSVAVDVFGKTYVSDTAFDPTRLSQNESFGVVPVNTTLTVTYRTTNPVSTNIATAGLNTVANSLFEFDNAQDLTDSTVQEVIQSLEVNNEAPIAGAVSYPSTVEIKQRIYDTFPTQNRAVTQTDYENMAYRMPLKFGSIKRCSVQKDSDSQKRNLNLYVISEDSEGKLIQSNSTIKNNLKTWVNNYRMINDTVDILDPFILNFGVEFIVKSRQASDKFTVLEQSVAALQEHYMTSFFIGEPLYLSDIYQKLKDVTGVLDVVKVKIISKSGGSYSAASIDINDNMSPDGTYLMVPNNAILELKYPEVDVVGKVT
mgnify:CR=1 FL=1|jgi:hypothetical protein|tara:strand:- start:2233 stop:4029 length:1797 start_codon:yes stop_codon:yes gene_type:complete